MRLWKKVSGALKDKNSIFVSSLSRRTPYRNPDLEAAIIKATSHDETRVDYKNAQRVFAWIRTSTTYLKPLIWALSTRIEKTRSWVVAIKGLMLMHGVFFLKSPAVRMIGRLPFDLSNFKEGSETNPVNAWGYSEFIRSYFAFLDQKSAFVCMDLNEEKYLNKEKQIEEPMVQQLIKLQHFQTLLDMLIQIKPCTQGMIGSLVLEAMDCVIIEIFDVYSRICNGIARVLIRIYGAGKIEASMALDILQKATLQGEQLSIYFELCRDIGVLNASEFPKVEQIPEEDIRDLERIINGVSERNSIFENVEANEERALAVIENEVKRVVNEERRLRTIVTEKWEKFEEDLKMANGDNEELVDVGRNDNFTHDLLGTALIIHPNVNHYKQEVPDFISF